MKTYHFKCTKDKTNRVSCDSIHEYYGVKELLATISAVYVVMDVAVRTDERLPTVG